MPSAFEIPYTVMPTAGKRVTLQVGVADPNHQEDVVLPWSEVEEYAYASLEDVSCCAKSPNKGNNVNLYETKEDRTIKNYN